MTRPLAWNFVGFYRETVTLAIETIGDCGRMKEER
jgi:hypothetical protein